MRQVAALDAPAEAFSFRVVCVNVQRAEADAAQAQCIGGGGVVGDGAAAVLVLAHSRWRSGEALEVVVAEVRGHVS